MLRRLSIRARITIGSVLIAVVIFGIALIGVRSQAMSILDSSNTTLAEGDLQYYSTEILANPHGLVDDSGKGLLVYVRDPPGRAELDTLPPAIRGIVEHRGGANERFTTQVDGVEFVVVGRVVATPTGNWSMWAARSQASGDLALRGLDVVFFTGAFVLLVAFGFASWGLATAALRPVARMRRKAEGLGADSTETLPIGASNDEISQLAVTLNAFLERVRQSTAREKQIVSDAAHEIRTPLAALKTQLELAHDDFGDAPALAEQVIAAQSSVARLSALATNLLELSRLESEHPAAEPSTTDRLVTELMGGIDRARMIGLSQSVEVGFTTDIVDPTARFAITAENFSRLVDNLLANGVSAVETGGLVSTELIERDDLLVLRVSDSGRGMPDTFLPHAFDRFSRADDARTTSSGGSGLGLALVHAIATMAGGTVTLENTPPGFVATVRLPKM